MKIDKSLNLIVPIKSNDGEIYFHHTPILRETFKKYSLVICKTFTELLQNGLELTGAKIAAMQLEEVAIKIGKWEGKEGVKDGLMEEITRLTNIICLTQNGWETLPVSIAISRDYVSEEDWEEAKQRIVFFTLICAMTTQAVKEDLLSIMNSSWGTRTESLSCMEFIASLQTLKDAETSSKNEIQSSLPV